MNPLSVVNHWSLAKSRFVAALGMTIIFGIVVPKNVSAQQAIVLKGGKLLTVSHGAIENGVLVMENGKITAVGSAAAVKVPANARVLDVSGMTLYPSLIDSQSYLGLTEISAEQMTNDLVELSDEIM
ncbi:MAG TPA: amidohydrolase, partial [Terriglobales bacterium]|nr:amidohydrolase [Terriglobales bacterium]